MDIYERHEAVVERGYYNDPRWKEVYKLREEGNHIKANGLVMSIRYDWGIE